MNTKDTHKGLQMTKLKFGKGNAKLDSRVATFSLPAGKTCPGANECKSMAIEKDGKRTIKDGPRTVFRCFAATQEVLYTNTFAARAHNLSLLKACGKGQKGQTAMTKLIQRSLPKKAKWVRVHVSGDFYSQAYFNAWLCVTVANPKVLFYAYTKSLPFWVNKLGWIPDNFVLTASVGGKHDLLIHAHQLRYAKVVYSEDEAKNLGLKIDHDDLLAMKHGPSFALLIHGAQPAGSESAKVWTKLRKAGKAGYSGKGAKVVLPAVSP